MRGVIEYPQAANAVAAIMRDHSPDCFPLLLLLQDFCLHQIAGDMPMWRLRQRYLALIADPAIVAEDNEREMADLLRTVVVPSSACELLNLSFQCRLTDLNRYMEWIESRAKAKCIDYDHHDLRAMARAYVGFEEAAYDAWRQAMPYDGYLTTAWWASVRAGAMERAGGRCQVCNADGPILDVHHRTYERLGQERDSDLTVLCRGCHELFHANGRLEVEPKP